ncbi:MAG: hypothetical protein A2868_03380 [Candidatus Levybacteria bacterium RIFCSPHIGHO2_01_FULL_40_15b]|nr:MAG: hypothetical protein A2868_03380 [Candidatus Levybacteria bacterium RIFCSPHIGHO2_01_FULL_40_15b]
MKLSKPSGETKLFLFFWFALLALFMSPPFRHIFILPYLNLLANRPKKSPHNSARYNNLPHPYPSPI